MNKEYRYILLELVNKGASESYRQGHYFKESATIKEIENFVKETYKASTLVKIYIIPK